MTKHFLIILLDCYFSSLDRYIFISMSQESKRRQIQLLLNGKRHSPKEISSMVGVSIATVYNLISRLKSETSLVHKSGAGRPGKLLPKIKHYVARTVNLNPAISIRNLAANSPVIVGRDTVSRCLRKLDYSKPYPKPTPLLSEKNRLYRIQWARNNIDNQWQHAVFADEASIWLYRGRVRMWTKRGMVRTQPTVKHSQKIHIWAAFSSMGTFPLCIFSQILNAELFVKILSTYLLAQAHVFHQDAWFLVQDNDPKHTAKLTKAWMEEKMPNKKIDWPSQSPDINPIENLFAWVKQTLIKRGPKNITELKEELTDVWENINADFLKNFWDSMPRRCQLVIDNNGHAIKY